MPITDEQAKYIKEQIFKQIETFPAEKREQVKEYISKMNNEELEEFLIKNKMIKQEGNEGEVAGESDEEATSEAQPSVKKGNECIMCLLSSKQVESLIIYEDKDYLAALEINPITKGHIILIPKQHLKSSKELKSKALTIANKIGKHITKKLEAENFQINTSDEIGHALINIITKYKGEVIDFKRKQAKKEELLQLFQKIGKIEKKVKIQKIKTEKSEQKDSKKEKIKLDLHKLPRRIP